jgi:energy-coupling factor transport system permease protein
MRTYDAMNPLAVAAQLLLTACITVFCMDPVLLGISLACAMAVFFLRNGTAHKGFHACALGIPALFALLNPLWNQHGSSVLFFINNRAITAEALYFGAVTGIRLAAVLYWFRIFSDLMTSEKLFYLLRFLSPKLALIFSMAVRNLTLFRQQMHKIQASQKALGLYREKHLIDDVRGGLRVFSILITWALENGIITASSMAARGYGCCRRTSCTNFRWKRQDVLLLLSTLLLSAGVIFLTANGVTERQFYPVVVPPVHGAGWYAAVTAYALLAMLPLLHEGKEALIWYRLRSGI